jgi:hypothetical protein
MKYAATSLTLIGLERVPFEKAIPLADEIKADMTLPDGG